jgi:hypothetical protein
MTELMSKTLCVLKVVNVVYGKMCDVRGAQLGEEINHKRRSSDW